MDKVCWMKLGNGIVGTAASSVGDGIGNLSLLTYLYINYSDNIWGEGILYGIKAAVIAIIFYASIKIAKKECSKHTINYCKKNIFYQKKKFFKSKYIDTSQDEC